MSSPSGRDRLVFWAFEILNVTRAVRCFDEAASDIQYVTRFEKLAVSRSGA